MNQKAILTFCFAIACDAAKAFGQALNVDFGANLSSPASSSYGAGAGQTGFWNAASLDIMLRDVNGNTTGVREGFSGGGTQLISAPGTAGDDKLFVESVFNCRKSTNGLGLYNLTPGSYDLYMYSWGPNIVGPQTVSFSVLNGATQVLGSLTTQNVWPGQHVEGVTYAKMRVEVVPDFQFLAVTTNFSGLSDFTVLSGLQLVPVPAPGAALPLLGVGMVLAARRRRGP